MSAPVSVDFETFYSKKLKYSVRTLIAEEYVRHDLFDAYLLSVSDGSQCWAGHPRDFNWDALDGKTLLSHNRYFDNTVYNELVKRGLAPKINIANWHCTANLTAYLCNRRALADAAEYLLQLKVDKSYRNVTDGKHWPQDYTAAEREQVIQSGRVDAHRCWTFWDKFSDQWPEVERRLSTLTIDQGMRGVQIDTDLLSDYLLWTFDAKQAVENLIPWMREAEDEDEDWDGFKTKPTSTKCIAEQCRRTKIPCPPTKADDEEGYQEWESQFGPQNPWIYGVSAWRSINKLHKTFQKVKQRLRSDGTLPFALKYFGSHTGRWAGDSGVNFQNFRKKPLFIRQDGLMESNEEKINDALKEHRETNQWPSWVLRAIDFRALIIPRPGKRMLLSDLSQIEPRVLAYLSGNTALLDMIRQGRGVYESFARTSMGFTGEWDKKSDAYQLFKIQVLQLGYAAGWRKFISTAWTENGLDLTKDDPKFVTEVDPITNESRQVPGYGFTARNIVDNFRKKNPLITGLWKRLDSALKASVGQDFIMTLPSGRKMRYDSVKMGVKIEPDESGKPRRQTVVTADVGGKRRPLYGGKLTENLVQAVARDVFGAQLARMTDHGLAVSFSVHDEAVLEVDQSATVTDIENEMAFCPEWLEGCPIAAEAREVSHYTK